MGCMWARQGLSRMGCGRMQLSLQPRLRLHATWAMTVHGGRARSRGGAQPARMAGRGRAPGWGGAAGRAQHREKKRYNVSRARRTTRGSGSRVPSDAARRLQASPPCARAAPKACCAALVHRPPPPPHLLQHVPKVDRLDLVAQLLHLALKACGRQAGRQGANEGEATTPAAGRQAGSK